ncbi:hypothetical protein [Paenibacillus lautus]|uniref:hypothetical protein n=1 Tax=Paenibacillus lautus TaxID=1401 RepID=UPI0010E53E49|nr:Uncharacterised protein [Actinobacillus pleuropneumoniae]
MITLRQKFISIFTVLAVFVCFVVSPYSAYAEGEETAEITPVTSKVVTELIDEIDTKKLVLEDNVEKSAYVIEVNKNNDGTYAWESSIKINDSIISNNSWKIKSLSQDFSMTKLADLVMSGDHNAVNDYYEQNIIFVEESEPSSGISPQAVFLIPLAAGTLTTAAIAAIEASVYSALTAVMAVAVVNVANDKKSTSTLTYPPGQTTTADQAEISNIPGDFTRSGTKHMEAALTTTIANQIKNDKNNDGDLQIFTNSLNGSNLAKKILVVYDVTTDATGLVNRHLGNTVNGPKVNPGIPDERMNLKGYTVFIIYDHQQNKVFHAHFTPTAYRGTELHYNRLLGGFNIRIYPTPVIINNSYLKDYNRSESDQLKWEQTYQAYKNLRNRNTLNKGQSDAYHSIIKRLTDL